MKFIRLLLGTLLAVALVGCSSPEVEPDAQDGAGSSSESSSGSTAEALLAEHDLDASDPVALVDEMDRMALDERPRDLMVSVRADELVVSNEEGEHTLDLPGDNFYVSLAPYVDETHECFYHSLTTCLGELGGEEVDVEIVTDDGETLVDDIVTVFDNGFAGFWLPKDVEGTIRVTYGDKTGEVEFATDAEAPTCVTTLQMV